MLYSGNIFALEDTKTCVYFLNTILRQRLNAIKIIQVGPTTPYTTDATMAVIQEASRMMRSLREIRILRTPYEGLPIVLQALNGRFQHVEITSRLTDCHSGETCCMK